MKNPLLLLLFFVATISACKKDKLVNGGSTPVYFTTTKYSYLGTYDDTGRPNYLVAPDMVSANLLSFVNDQLPERGDIRNKHPEYLKNADLSIAAKSEVFITFVNEGSAFTNSLGYYLFKTGNPPTKPENIENIVYMFPNGSNLSSGGLKPGDKISLGVIAEGMSVGFVLLEKGWDPVAKKVNAKAPHYTSNKALNPENRDELKQHTVLIEYPSENKTIIGFEALNRTLPECDHDFNDVVIYATLKPVQ
ncbi:MAG: DUF4114 domain-containing protein [Flavobacterium sp.]|nr:DUF4114 domain-containing protein [Pedobacter sp.]